MTFLRNVFAREILAEEAEAAPRQARRAPRPADTLAFEPQAGEAPHRPGILHALFAPETLAVDPERTPRARPRGILRALFAPEPLETLPALARTTRPTRWLRWLAGPEPLDPP